MKGIRFRCPDCGALLKAKYATMGEDQRLYLVGPCEACKETYRWDIEKVIFDLYAANKVEKKVN